MVVRFSVVEGAEVVVAASVVCGSVVVGAEVVTVSFFVGTEVVAATPGPHC